MFEDFFQRLFHLYSKEMSRSVYLEKFKEEKKTPCRVTDQFRATQKAGQTPRIMEQSLEPIVINVVLKLSQQSTDEIADEDHLCLECAEHREQDGLEGSVACYVNFLPG